MMAFTGILQTTGDSPWEVHNASSKQVCVLPEETRRLLEECEHKTYSFRFHAIRRAVERIFNNDEAYTHTGIGLRSNFMTDQEGHVICSVLPRNCYLTSLDLSGNRVGEETTLALGTALLRNSTLQVLNLATNALQDRAVECIAGGLQQSCSLQVLDLSDNELTLNGVCAVARAVAQNTSLTELTLGGNSHRQPRMASQSLIRDSFGPLFRMNTTLTRLVLDEIPFGDLLAPVCAGLSDNTALEYLSLASIDMSAAAAVEMAKVLRPNTCLRHLVLNDNGLGRGALSQELPAHLARLNVTELALEGIPIEDERFLVHIIQNSCSLRIIRFSAAVVYGSAEALLDALGRNGHLRAVHGGSDAREFPLDAITAMLRANLSLRVFDWTFSCPFTMLDGKTPLIRCLSERPRLREVVFIVLLCAPLALLPSEITWTIILKFWRDEHDRLFEDYRLFHRLDEPDPPSPFDLRASSRQYAGFDA